MALIRLVLDFETYYRTKKDVHGKSYSLSSMTVPEYIFDRQFQVIGMSVRTDTHDMSTGTATPLNETARWIPAALIPAFLARLDPKKYALVSHNILFDGAILAWVYGWVPALYIDTLGLARALIRAFTGRASLAACAKYYQLPDKGDEVVRADGMRLEDFEADERAGGTRFAKYRSYCMDDTNICSWILDRLAPQLPPKEFIIMDSVIRMALQPQLQFNIAKLEQHLVNVRTMKRTLIRRISGIVLGREVVWPEDEESTDYRFLYNECVSLLRSDEKFAAVLRVFGIEPPTKISPKTGKEAFAFSKTDRDFMDLQEHEDPDVQAIVGARIGVKTTLEESRTERFIAVASCAWQRTPPQGMLPLVIEHDPLPDAPGTPVLKFPHVIRSLAPMALAYGAAHTSRLGGEWKMNPQNLGRDSDLKAGIEAPDGYVVVQADASQIEARTVGELAGCTAITEPFRLKQDLYSKFASTVYGFEVNKRDHVPQRFVGKTCILGLGFGMGAPKLKTSVWVQSKGKQEIDEPLAERSVKTYRTEYREIPAYWKLCDRMIDMMIAGGEETFGPITVKGNRILLPNGLWLFYNDIRKERVPNKFGPGEMDQVVFKYGHETNWLFGGKLTENIVQGVARAMTMDAAYRIRMVHKCPWPAALQIHDALYYVVPKSEGMAMAKLLVEEMRKPPAWLPNIPLDAEASIGTTFKNMQEVKGL